MKILTKPWFIAILALVSMVGTQVVAFKLYWDELFPPREKALVVKRDEPQAFSWGFATDEIAELQLELKTRLSSLSVREQQLREYEARLKADRDEIEDVKRQVEVMRGRLLDDIVRLEADEQKNLKTLAKTYSTLTPDAAVSIFDKLDHTTVVKIMFFMKNDVVGAILQEMSTGPKANDDSIKRAAEISNMLRLFSENSPNTNQPQA